MKAPKFVLPAIISTLLTISTVWAAGGRQDNSGILVWVFLAFCAAIVLLQLVPALLMMFGFMKSLKPTETEQVTQDEQ